MFRRIMTVVAAKANILMVVEEESCIFKDSVVDWDFSPITRDSVSVLSLRRAKSHKEISAEPCGSAEAFYSFV
jgi:hypothetical protein